MNADLKIKITSILLVLSMLAALLVGCVGGTGDDTTVGDPDTTTSGAVVDETTEEPEPPVVTLEDGALIYYENFENYSSTLADNDAVMEALGWTIDSIKGGAYSDNTAKYSIADHQSSKRLFISNPLVGNGDCYVTVLSGAQLGAYHMSNYTYQYDLIYTVSASDGYISLLSGYDGNFYNMFSLSNRGNGAHGVREDGEWYDYDFGAAALEGGSSMATKLLGKKYSPSASAFENIDFSIRYTVDWEKGNTVYVRINTDGYPGSGKWTLVGTYKPHSQGAEYHDIYAGGGALALKTGGRMSAYIDNITVWAGTGEAPSDKSATPVLTSKTEGCSGHVFRGSGICEDVCGCVWCGELSPKHKGHNYLEVPQYNDQRCADCGYIKGNKELDWSFSEIPYYDGGKKTEDVYLSGQDLDDTEFAKENESRMHMIYGTTLVQFEAYLDKLEAYGFEQKSYRTLDQNVYAEYVSGDIFTYVYYSGAEFKTRVIHDVNSDSTAAEFGYVREKKSTETTIVYQYGLPMNEEGVDYKNNNEKKINCGMMYVIKLADNSVIIIDGGSYQQFDTAQIDGFMTFLREVTGTTKNEKIRIAGWYITHAHVDHFAGVCLFFKKYSENFTLERIFCNFPSVHSDHSTLANHKSNTTKLIGYIDQYLGQDYEFLQIHTGQRFNLGEVTVDVMYTHEDIVSMFGTKLESQIGTDFNNSCSVIRFEFDGKTFMMLGDVNRPAMEVMLKNYSDATLRTDIVQMSHHVINNLEELYHKTRASVAFAPQSPNGCVINATRQKAMNSVKPYLKNNMLYYASLGTNGIKVIAGNLSMVYYRAVDGGPHSGWSW